MLQQAEPAEGEGIDDHCHRARRHGCACDGRVEIAHRRQWNSDDIIGSSPEESLYDLGANPPRQGQGLEYQGWLRPQQHQGGTGDRRVGAARHRDPEVSCRQCWGVVDAIADHCDQAAACGSLFCHQSGDQGALVVGQDIAVVVIDADFARQPADCCLGIA